MRQFLPILVILSFLGACASTKDIPANKSIPQSGPLKVAPELLGNVAQSQAPAK